MPNENNRLSTISKPKLVGHKQHTAAGRRLIASAKEILAHARGELSLPMRIYPPETGRAIVRALEAEKDEPPALPKWP